MSLSHKLLEFLEANREHALSGEALATKLGVSRAAVWKAMKRLQTQGHQISAVSNKGYRLVPESDLLTAQGIALQLLPAYRGNPVIVEATVDSTNTLAKKMAADGAVSGTILVADSQSHGRGRLGRSFFSPPESGIYMSIILHPKAEDASRLPVITIAAAVAVCQAIEELTPVRPKIKWVNDLFVNRKKVCGILTEAVSDFESGHTETVVVGIGLNVKTPENLFPPELQKMAGSLLPSQVSRNALAGRVANHLLSNVEILSDRCLIDAYRERLFILGKQLQYRQGTDWKLGTALDIDENGCLIIETLQGQILLRAGEIQLMEDTQ